VDAITEAARRFDLGRIHVARGETSRALELLDEARSLARGQPALKAAIDIERAKIGLSNWDAAQALAAARNAAAAAARAGAHVPAAQIVLGQALYVAGREEATACFRRARRLARRAGDVEAECEAATLLASSLQAFGHCRSALQAAEAARQLGSEHGRHRWEQRAARTAARLRVFTFGDYQRGIPALIALLRARGIGETRTHLRVDIAVACAQVGRREEARAALNRARRLANDPFSCWLVVWAEVELELAAGRPARALAAIEHSDVESAPVDAMLERCRLWALYDLGRVEAGSAPPTHPLLAGAQLELRGFSALAGGDATRAAALFDEAATAWGGNILYCALEARWLALELRGRPAKELRALERRAARHGLEPILARVRRSLRASERRSPAPSGRELTPRERQVLELVAEGLTSARIARRLRIKRSTVETHIAVAMAKLGARTRLEAARLLVGRPGGTVDLDDETRAVLEHVGRGASICEVAERLGISRRTATRRLAVARASLGVATTAEAVVQFGNPRGMAG
jgi:DNA-binding NarL/FixJ family response regulator